MKWLRNILKGATLSTALFIFQACYGVPQSELYETGYAPMTFVLESASDGQPLEGIRIIANMYRFNDQIGVTDASGRCKVDIPFKRDLANTLLTFEDPDGNYMAKDTVLEDYRERDVIVKLLDSAK